MQVPRVWGDRRLLYCAIGAAMIAALVGLAARDAAPRASATAAAPAGDTVLAQVGAPDPIERDELAAARGGDRGAAVRLARRDVERARRTADPRHYGRAQAVLAPWWSQPVPPDDVLLLRATIRQAVHEFAGARADLDVLLAHHPEDLQARLTRAAVATVTGDLATAAADCDEVARGGDLIALACAAPLVAACDARGGASVRAGAACGDAAGIATDLETALGDGAIQPGIAVWGWASLGDLRRQLGDDAAAEQAYRKALAIDATDTFTLTHLADLLLDRGRPADVVALLRAAGESDGVLLRLAIAERRANDPAGAVHAKVVRQRLAAGIARGDHSHGREVALFRLHVEGDAAGALEAALENWELQKESLDARVVLDTAAAAKRPAAATAVLAWLDANQVHDAVLDRARATLGGAR